MIIMWDYRVESVLRYSHCQSAQDTAVPGASNEDPGSRPWKERRRENLPVSGPSFLMLRLQGVWLYLKIILGLGGQGLCHTEAARPRKESSLK